MAWGWGPCGWGLGALWLGAGGWGLSFTIQATIQLHSRLTIVRVNAKDNFVQVIQI